MAARKNFLFRAFERIKSMFEVRPARCLKASVNGDRETGADRILLRSPPAIWAKFELFCFRRRRI